MKGTRGGKYDTSMKVAACNPIGLTEQKRQNLNRKHRVSVVS